MVDGNLTDDPCSSLRTAPAVNESEFPVAASNGEQPTIVQASPQDHQYLRQSEVSGYRDPANLRNSPKYQPPSDQSTKVSSETRCHCIACTYVSIAKFERYRYIHCFQERNRFLHEGKYKCNASYCTRSFKRWEDLTRHVSSVHCKNPPRFPCPILWCKHSGENGFTRKDKMKSHYKEVHEGNRKVNPNTSRTTPRTILPATGGVSAQLEPSRPAGEYGAGERENKGVRRS